MELQVIQSKIYGIRGQRVMPNFDLGRVKALYENDLVGFVDMLRELQYPK
jgi:hypothetical protein